MKKQWILDAAGRSHEVTYHDMEVRSINEDMQAHVARMNVGGYHAEIEVEGTVNPTGGAYGEGSTPDAAIEAALENLACGVPF